MSSTRRVAAPDGVSIAAYDSGRPAGRAVLLIHAYSQSHLCWSRQFGGSLAGRFRLAAMDLRGHGASPTPTDSPAYPDGRRWADAVAAVIERLDLRRLLLHRCALCGRLP